MVGVIYLAVCVALVLGGPIGGALMELAGAGDMHGWQWMFLVEGIVTVLLGFGILRWLPDKPADAPWLDAGGGRGRSRSGPPSTTRPRTRPCAAMSGSPSPGRSSCASRRSTSPTRSPASAIQYNFPSIVENLDLDGPFMVGLVSGSVGLGALAGVLIVPRPSQRRVRNEVRVIAVCSVAGTAVAIAYVLASGPVAPGRPDRPRHRSS